MRHLFTFLFLSIAISAFSQTQGNNTINDETYAMAGLQVQPEYPGGLSAFLKEVSHNFRVPDVSTDLDVKIYVSFVIEKDGSISSVKCTRDPGYGLGNEAVRTVESIKTKWSPGIQNEKPVRVSYMLPIKVVAKAPKPAPVPDVPKN